MDAITRAPSATCLKINDYTTNIKHCKPWAVFTNNSKNG